ncbi:MAG TPA: tyrosine--tRNA ligase [Candidatus Deferrimicrobiaceae bacterium]|nr:tyrosine--tRNA ligase [Candidatus Deferrimicrobiaceae bacterium]
MTASDPGLSGFLAELRWRGQFHAASDGLEARLASERPLAAYNGFDPSGPWLHIGHLVPIFGLIRLQAHGGQPIVVVGGGTGMIGDPSGKSSERNLLSREVLEANVASIRPQLERFLDFSGARGARLVNNLDWLEPIRLLDFLRDVGKHFTVPYMLAKDSVRVRLEGGLSFTEFSYMLIQATDFAHLRRTMGVELQMGGADQWGNITAGLELIRRAGDGEGSPNPAAFALAYPLLLNASGAKFGKSETGDSVWLHPDGTSPFAFYQHWLNTDDRDVSTYLRWFTTFAPDEIEALEAALAARPEAREAQRTLALDITARVHGGDVARAVAADSELLFGGEPIRDPAVFERLFPNVEGSFVVDAPASSAGTAAVLADAGVFASRGEARRAIAGGGVSINGERVTHPAAAMPPPVAGRWWEVRVGKRRRVLARLEPG